MCQAPLSSQVHSSGVGVPGLPLAEGAGGAAAGDDHGWSEGHRHQGGLHGWVGPSSFLIRDPSESYSADTQV